MVKYAIFQTMNKILLNYASKGVVKSVLSPMETQILSIQKKKKCELLLISLFFKGFVGTFVNQFSEFSSEFLWKY